MPVIDVAPPATLSPRRSAPPRPLRIGVMLRGVGEYDGAGVYIRKLMDALLALNPELVLLGTPFRCACTCSRFAHRSSKLWAPEGSPTPGTL